MPKDRIAIVHDFFVQNAGAELVVENLLELYPDSDIITSVYIAKNFASMPMINKAFVDGRVKKIWLQAIFDYNNGGLVKYFKHFFWLYPIVMSCVRLEGYDKIIISSTNCGKNIRILDNPKLIHYCHTPTRYLYNLSDTEEQLKLRFPLNWIYKLFIPILRYLDQRAVKHLNSKNCIWVANSVFIQGLIEQHYHSQSQVIYPPVDTSKFGDIVRRPGDYYLCHGRVSFHKRIDLAIMACLVNNKNLKISGTSALSSEILSLQKIVEDYQSNNPDNISKIEFLGRTSDDELIDLISGAKALLFPGREDFGIAPIEMISSGLPVMAYQAGGAVEYIQERINGIFFTEQTVDSISEALMRFETLDWVVEEVKGSIKGYDKSVFAKNIKEIVGY
jgi:glycosyltransferase involved in cell wall biosynthesis